MKALLIIDMQAGSFTAETPRFDTDGVVSRINGLSDVLRDLGHKVIFIQHDGTKENSFLPGTPEWEILPSLIQSPADIIVSKTANDAFYESDLARLLTENGIRELIITGCASDFCVDTTVRSALGRDYEVTVVQDGHTTADRPHCNAETVIAHHNWIWENMTPTRGNLRVISSDELMREVQNMAIPQISG